jgi:anti-sigma factor RsiW
MRADDIQGNQGDPQVWLDYLDGKLPEDQRLRLEEEIGRSEFLKEALEGLRPIRDKVDVAEVTRQLNQQLRKQLASRKRKRGRKAQPSLLWTGVAIILILVLIFAGFYIYTHLR